MVQTFESYTNKIKSNRTGIVDYPNMRDVIMKPLSKMASFFKSNSIKFSKMQLLAKPILVFFWLEIFLLWFAWLVLNNQKFVLNKV